MFWFQYSLWFMDFLVFFSLWLLVFVNITNGFLDLVSDVVFSFSYLGSGFLSI